MTTSPHRLRRVILSGVVLLALVVAACGPHATASGRRAPSAASPASSPAASPAAGLGSPLPSPSAVTGDVWERGDPDLVSVAQAGLVRALSLSDTHDSITLTLERAYADANRIVIGYRLGLPETLGEYGGISAGMQVTPLTDSAGRSYAGTSGGGFADASGVLSAHVLSFDASPLPPGVPEATFDLTFPEVTGIPKSTSKTEVLARGPWHFHFTVPVQPGRVIDQPQQVTAAGSTVRLERVVMTPSLTRVWVRITPPDGDASWHWVPIVDLEGPGYVSGGAGGSNEVPPGSGLFNHPFLTPPGRSGARWMVNVSELVGMKPPPTPAEKSHRRIAGPWVFTFLIGAASDAAVHPPIGPSAAPTTAGAARAALDRFMQARLQREDAVVLDLLVDNLRALGGQEKARRQVTQASNACWYRYDVLVFGQPTLTSATSLVRVYTHSWGGDVMGGVPRSWQQEIGLSSTAIGWRVERLEAPQDERQEPNEPHGRTTSACTVPRGPTAEPAGTATPVRP